MEQRFMRWTIATVVIVVGLTLACWAFPEMRALLPEWLVDQP